jgi:hypothetical protein
LEVLGDGNCFYHAVAAALRYEQDGTVLGRRLLDKAAAALRDIVAVGVQRQVECASQPATLNPIKFSTAAHNQLIAKSSQLSCLPFALPQFAICIFCWR